MARVYFSLCQFARASLDHGPWSPDPSVLPPLVISMDKKTYIIVKTSSMDDLKFVSPISTLWSFCFEIRHSERHKFAQLYICTPCHFDVILLVTRVSGKQNTLFAIYFALHAIAWNKQYACNTCKWQESMPFYEISHMLIHSALHAFLWIISGK